MTQHLDYKNKILTKETQDKYLLSFLFLQINTMKKILSILEKTEKSSEIKRKKLILDLDTNLDKPKDNSTPLKKADFLILGHDRQVEGWNRMQL